MALTQLQLQALQAELSGLLLQARLQQLREPAPGQYQLDFYQPQTPSNHSLLIDLSQGQSWLMLQPLAQNSQPKPSGWCMLLRKHLLNQSLQQITLATSDRLIQLHFSQGPVLILELSGRHANLFLSDAQGLVLGMAHRDTSLRDLKNGAAYCLPAPPAARPARDPLQLASLPADGSRSAALWQYYQQRRQQANQQRQVQTLLRRVQQQITRLSQRLQQTWEDLAREEAAKVWQEQGELLRAAFGKVSPGQTEVQVPDYYQAETPLRNIALNPALDLAGNIQHCFQQARRCERAARYALGVLPTLETELTEKQVLQSQALAWQNALKHAALAMADATELQAAWQGLISQPEQPGLTGPQPVHQPAWRFSSLTGKTIWVGKNARDNSTLLNAAKSSDFWLHLRDGTGSHVVVPCAKKQQPDPETLLDAATLALVHSSHYRPPLAGLKAEVWVARIHQLQRPKGAKPGQVQVLPGARSLNLRFEPERWQRLQASQC